MVFAPGSRLGPYEILASLGAGGMGEVYRAADAAQHVERGAHVLVVARRENAASSLPEPSDARAILGRQAIPRVESEEPKLVEVRLVEPGEQGLWRSGRCLAVSSEDLEARSSLIQAREVLPQKLQSVDRPIVRLSRRSRLDQDPNRSGHGLPQSENSGHHGAKKAHVFGTG
jgi:hypothetical protein